MATFAFKPQYTYKPTPPRPKSTATRRKPALEQVSILNKLQHIRSSGASLSTLRPAVAAANDDDNGAYGPGIRGTSTVHSGSDKSNNDETDDDRDFPTIEELLFTKLQAQGFTTGGQGPDRTGEVEEVAADERGGSVDQSWSAQSDNSGRSPDDPIVLGDGNLSASEGEANDVSLRAESVTVPGAGLFDKPETAIDWTRPAPPGNSEGWHDIGEFPEPARRLRLAEQGGSTPDSLAPHTPSSRLWSEPLHERIISTDFQATTPSSPPLHYCRASPETQLSQEGHFQTGQGVADEHELVNHALDTLLIDEGARKQQEVEQEQELDEGSSEDEDERPQQEMNVMAPVVTAERTGGSLGPANRQQSLPNLDRSSEPSHDEAGSRSGSDSDEDLNSTDSAEDDKNPRPIKRKQLCSSPDGPTRKKRRRPLQERSSRRRRPSSKPHCQYLNSHTPSDRCSKVATSSSAKGRLPSSAPTMPQTIDTKISLSDLSPSSRDTPPTLIEITFRPHSAHCYSFTAVVRDGHDGRGVSLAQVVRLLASTGHVGKIDDFTIKPAEQHLYLLSGFSRHTSSPVTAEADRDHVDAMRTRTEDGKGISLGALTSWGSLSSGEDDETGSSHSDCDLGSEGDSDEDECSSEDELGCPGTRINVPWDPLDEQRLLAYKKECKSWKWIFRQFPGRTENAVHQRLSIVKRRGG